MPIVNRVADLHDEITAWRRDLHAHPELLYDVHRTAAAVAEKLKALAATRWLAALAAPGWLALSAEPGRGSGQSDRAARRHGCAADRGSKRPSVQSTVHGKMHACGHDGHSAMLLGAARYLAETRNFAGTAVLIFQPAEEAGWRKAMVQDGLMERFAIERVFGMHNYPGLRSANSRSGRGQ